MRQQSQLIIVCGCLPKLHSDMWNSSFKIVFCDLLNWREAAELGNIFTQAQEEPLLQFNRCGTRSLFYKSPGSGIY